MRFILGVLGVIVIVALGWLYQSDRARAARQQLGKAPRAAVDTVTAGAQRVAEAVRAAPVPEPIKARVAAAAHATAEKLTPARAGEGITD